MKITVVGSGRLGDGPGPGAGGKRARCDSVVSPAEKAEELKRTRENPMLKGVQLPESLHHTADLNAAGESEWW